MMMGNTQNAHISPDEHQETSRELSAFEKEVWGYRKDMLNFAMRKLRDFTDPYSLAEELVQESILKAFRHSEQFRKGCSVKSWLSSIVIHTIIDYMRVNKTTRFQSLESIREDGFEFGEEIGQNCSEDRLIDNIDRSNGSDVMNAVMTLPAEYRSIILLRYVNEMSYEEIAGHCQLHLGTVKSRISRAMTALRKKMGVVVSSDLPDSDMDEVEFWDTDFSELDE